MLAPYMQIVRPNVSNNFEAMIKVEANFKYIWLGLNVSRMLISYN